MKKAFFRLWELAYRFAVVNISAREIPVMVIIRQRPAFTANPRLAEGNNVVYRLATRSHVESKELSCSAAQAMPCNPAPPDVLPQLGPFPYCLEQYSSNQLVMGQECAVYVYATPETYRVIARLHQLGENRISSKGPDFKLVLGRYRRSAVFAEYVLGPETQRFQLIG